MSLSHFSAHPRVRFIVSVDDINTMWYWDDQILDQYKFLFCKADTFIEYDHEKEYSDPLFTNKNESEQIALDYVFKSMTHNM